MLIRQSENLTKNAYIKESEPARLQRDIEQMTQKLEKERRAHMIWDDQIRALQDDIKNIQSKQKHFPQQKLNNLSNLIQVLERKLVLNRNNLNSVQADNMKLRDEIDMLRREKTNKQQAIIIQKLDLNEVKSSAKENNQSKVFANYDDLKQKKQLIHLRSRSANTRRSFNTQISHLTVIFNQSVLKEDHYKVSQAYHQFEDNLNVQVNRGNDVLEGIKVIRDLLNQWRKKCYSKRLEYDNYVRSIKSIKDCFKAIRHATGMTEIEEIVTSFIKSEEQKSDVLTYINNINAQIDQLEEVNRRQVKLVQKLTSSQEQGHLKENNFKSVLSKQIQKYQRLFKKVSRKVVYAKQSIEQLPSQFEKFNQLLNPLHLSIDYQDLINYKTITELEIGQIAGQLERCIIKLQIVQSQLQKQQFPLADYIKYNKRQQYTNVHINSFIQQKTLYEDQDTQDSQNPLQLSYMREKALRLSQDYFTRNSQDFVIPTITGKSETSKKTYAKRSRTQSRSRTPLLK